MSDTTPETPNGGPVHAAPEDEAGAAADWDTGVVNPPSEPVPASGHVSAPESSVPTGEPAEPAAEPATSEPESAAPSTESPSHSTDTGAVAPVAFSDSASQDSSHQPPFASEPVAVPVSPRFTSEPTAATGDVPPVAFTGDVPVVAAAADKPAADAAVADASVDAPSAATDSAPVTAPTASDGVAPAAVAAAAGTATTGAATVGAATAGAASADTATGTAPAAVPPTAAYGQPVSPIYVSAPLPPKKKSNRGFGIIVSLIATLVFAIVYAAVVAAIGLVNYTPGSFLHAYTTYLATAAFYVTVIFFFIAMVLLIQIVNRASWWVYIIGGFFVAVVVYFSFIGGAVLQSANQLNPAEASRLVGSLWLSPFGIAGGIVAREVSIWAGAWLAARGRKLKVKNAEAREEYDRKLAAGPQQGGYQPGT
jgi:hypothetical protein